MGTVTEEGLSQVKRNFQWVADKLDAFMPEPRGLVSVCVCVCVCMYVCMYVCTYGFG